MSQPIYLTHDIRRIEQAATEVPLMQRAGAAAAELAARLSADTAKDVLVLAGPGNNGGDAKIVADILRQKFFRVTLAGASFLSSCMAFTGIPRALAEWVAVLAPNKYLLIAILAGIYLLLGTALDGVSMIVLTTSIVLPMVEKAGFDLVWFGIFIVLLVEIAELTPPLGFNIFVLQTMTGRDSNYVALASLPFFFMMVLCIALITLFPEIVTWLPDVLLSKPK